MDAPAPHPAPAHEHPGHPPLRRHAFPASLPASKPHLGCGKPVSAQTVGHVSGAPHQAETHDQCNPPCPSLALALVRLAAGLGCSATSDLSPLASAGIPLVLEMEIQA